AAGLQLCGKTCNPSKSSYNNRLAFANVAEVVDAPDLGSGAERCESSSLSVRTTGISSSRLVVNRKPCFALPAELPYLQLSFPALHATRQRDASPAAGAPVVCPDACAPGHQRADPCVS